MLIIRKIMRAFGLPVHVGWKPIHKSGFQKQCVGCGEKQGQYSLGGHPRITWWETEWSGDGSCGTKPLPTRIT